MKQADRNNDPLDAVLRRAMRQRPGAATPECADLESLAAYSDRSLAAAARGRLEAHFADCARCQMLLADIARAEQHTIGARAGSKTAWFRRWRLAIPALAAIAAIVIFIAIRRPGNRELPSVQVVAMAKHEAPLMPAPVPMPASAPAAPAANELAMNELKPEAAPRAQAMSAAAPRALQRRAAAPGAQAMSAQAGAAPQNAGAPGFGGAAVASGAAVGGGGAVSASNAGAAGASMLVTISPPDGSVTWFVGKNGTIRRRDADGGTHLQQSGVSTDLIAGAAPSAAVCWIVGRSGTIIRTTDGEHWMLVASPTTEDLVAVSASSASDAIVTTAGGDSFATSDGGASWHRQ